MSRLFWLFTSSYDRLGQRKMVLTSKAGPPLGIYSARLPMHIKTQDVKTQRRLLASVYNSQP